MSPAVSRWVEDGAAVLVTGLAGSGKCWLACALAQCACRRGQSALYLRVPRLAEELRLLHGSGGCAADAARWSAASPVHSWTGAAGAGFPTESPGAFTGG
jgi:energy-coupling factor transporter ATP-binding protein EcfA2